MKLKDVDGTYWAYFAPNGHVQVRSIAETKKDAREFIRQGQDNLTYKDYEESGYVLKKIKFKVTIHD